jgi:hypothetical protein
MNSDVSMGGNVGVRLHADMELSPLAKLLQCIAHIVAVMLVGIHFPCDRHLVCVIAYMQTVRRLGRPPAVVQ